MDDVRGQRWFKEFSEFLTKSFLNIYNNRDVEFFDVRITFSKRRSSVHVSYPTHLGQKSEDVPLELADDMSD